MGLFVIKTCKDRAFRAISQKKHRKSRFFGKKNVSLQPISPNYKSEMATIHRIELLAPARTADVGIEAFGHGADAVYIGAPAFSARAAAGNSVADVERLAAYGHQYGGRTIVALNTILTDAELREAERLAWQLYDAGVDALIIQDLGLLQMHLPPIELHASTQTDNRTPEKVRLLRDLGMTRVVMARELSVEQIRAIHEAVPDVELECFIHGALCVCVSGQCYLSAALTGRSANRGECAQPCRLPMDLYASNGQTLLAQQRHLLSLRDMNRSAYIEQLVDAGVTSLKVEGRLKDVTYVKNVVAYYRRLIDQIIDRRPDCQAVSYGRCEYTFEPNLAKSFNRGFTPYFADGERAPMWNFESPKSMGEKVGRIAQVGRDRFTLEGLTLNNGDGLVVGPVGFRLNRYDKETATCYPLDGAKVCRQLKAGLPVHRNLDAAFEQLLSRPSATRTLALDLNYEATPEALTLRLTAEDGISVTVTVAGRFEPAERPQADNVRRQLGKLGGTLYRAREIAVDDAGLFVPSSLLADLRRRGVETLTEERLKMQTQLRKSFCATDYAKRASEVDATGILPTDYRANLMNEKARQTYAEMGLEKTDYAFEVQQNKQGMVMQTRHCLKYAFGQCPRYPNPKPEKLLDPKHKIGGELQLGIGNRKFILKFGCKNDCYCEIFTIFAPSENKKTT